MMPKDDDGSPPPFVVRIINQVEGADQGAGGRRHTVEPGAHLKLEVECRRQEKVSILWGVLVGCSLPR